MVVLYVGPSAAAARVCLALNPVLAYVLFSLQIIEAELRSTKRWELTAEGEEIAREGSHEARVFYSVPPEGLAQSELMVGTGRRTGPREVLG